MQPRRHVFCCTVYTLAAKSAHTVILSVYVYVYALAVSSRYSVFYVDCSGDSTAQLQIVHGPRTVSEK